MNLHVEQAAETRLPELVQQFGAWKLVHRGLNSSVCFDFSTEGGGAPMEIYVRLDLPPADETAHVIGIAMRR